MKEELAYNQGMSSFHYGLSHYVFTSVVLIANGNTYVILLIPVRVLASLKIDAYV
jgi:hypothetical protein